MLAIFIYTLYINLKNHDLRISSNYNLNTYRKNRDLFLNSVEFAHYH